MEKPYVFCGCQTYPSASAGSNSKSCWEWDIPTPKPKTKKISQSNPILPTPKRFDMDRINKRYSDNLYEPVNPPPIYGSGYNVHKDHDTASLDERMIEIPPDIEIITSEGLDGLDLQDPHDLTVVDGDREWFNFHPDPEDPHSQKAVFTAGIRNKELPKVGETSSVRPLSNKTISFSPDVPQDDAASSVADHEVPTADEAQVQEAGPSKPSALEQLKNKAGQVKQRISKISLPVRPKFNQWTGIKLAKKKGKDKKSQEEPEEVEVPEQGGWTEPLSLIPEAERPKQIPIPEETIPAPQPLEFQVVPEANNFQIAAVSTPTPELQPVIVEEHRKTVSDTDKKRLAEEAKIKGEEEKKKANDEKKTIDDEKKKTDEEKKKADEELKRLKAEEKLQREREQEDLKRLKEQEKLQKQKEQEEQKRLKAEEKAKKDEEQKRLKAEEKLRKEKEKEEQKRQKAEEKQQKDKLDEELRRAKEEEILKAKELQDQMVKELAESMNMPMSTEDEEADHAGEEPEPPPSKASKTQESKPPKTPESKRAKTPEPKPPKTPESKRAKTPEPKPPKTPESKRAKTPESSASKPAKTPEKKRKFIDMDFTKRFKRSKTPPPRPDPPKTKFSRKHRPDETQNQLAAQYGLEIEAREEEGEQDRLGEPQIYITQPSVEVDSETTSDTQRWPFEERHHSQKIEYDEEEEYEEDNDEERVPTPSKQQGKGEFSRKLKGVGVKSKAIAAQTGKNLGNAMKVLGHGIKEFGVNAVQEVKAKQEAVRQRDAQRKADRELAAAEEGEEAYQPKTKFKFRRRGNKPEVTPITPMVLEELPEGREIPVPRSSQAPPRRHSANERKPRNKEEEDDGKLVTRSQLLGRADRDWESPLDLVQSRDASEEPFSGQASSRDSPRSSMASSSILHGRRQGVLEEIDSDEFFLRERGISEGEDEEEVNRFLVEELRQAFRPTMNALEGFDHPGPPSRPGRSPKKPPRKGNRKSPTNFQTFPPERPKRKRTPGYISAYINANPEDEEEYEEEEEVEPETAQEEVTSIQEEEEEEDEGIRRVKEELRKIDQDLEDDGRYEPVNEEQEPIKPARRRKQPKLAPAQGFYYNTIAANEWMRDLENQIEDNQLELNLVDDTDVQPVPPKRVKSKSGSLVPDIDDSEINFADDDIEETIRLASERVGEDDIPPLAPGESGSRIGDEDFEDTLDYVDEAGYAVVHKDVPKTFPRKKKKKSGNKGNSLKRRSQEVRPDGTSSSAPTNVSGSSNGMFFSLPRYTPRTFHIVPPTRPHRTYSTLRPKRPPRNKTKSNQNIQDIARASPAPPARPITPVSPSLRRGDDDSRPSTAIGIMQGRPLPPPPRPDRSPAPQNDLDQATIERMVNMRHYANFDDDIFGPAEVIEEPCVARNIPLLMHGDAETGSILANSEINVAVQTDPVHDEDFELNIAVGSFEDEEERIEKQSSVSHLPSDAHEHGEEEQVPPPIPHRPLPRPSQHPLQPPQIVFPTRLHLDELEVDVLRVNDLTANTMSLTQLTAPHLELNSLSSRGPLSVTSIISPNLTVENVDCNRLTSDAAELPSIPPPSFYNLSSPLSRPLQNLSVERSVESEESQENAEDCCPISESSAQDEGGVRSQRTPVASAPATRSSTLPDSVSRTSSLHADPDLEDIAHLSMRLGRALLRVTVRSLHAMAEYVEVAASNDPNCQEQQRSNMQVLLCLLLVLVAGIILISRSGSLEPRWQYFLPPADM